MQLHVLMQIKNLLIQTNTVQIVTQLAVLDHALMQLIVQHVLFVLHQSI